MEKVKDPNFQAGVRGYVSEAGKRAGEVGRSANTWTKSTLGVDVAESVGGVVGTVKDRVGGGPQRQGYGVVQQGALGESSSLYQDQDEDDFFDAYDSTSSASHPNFQSPTSATTLTSRGNDGADGKKKEEAWDDWKDF